MMLEGREGRRVQQFEIVTMINRLGIVYLGLRATIRTRFKALDRCALLPPSLFLSLQRMRRRHCAAFVARKDKKNAG